MKKLPPTSAPLFEQLVWQAERNTASYHVPGHKSGKMITDELEISSYKSILQIDLTEITGLDDLHHPEGAIAEAQQLAAECFGAKRTFFLVNGSTVGNLAVILSLCRPGDQLIVQRNVHKSVIHGLMLAGAEAIFIQPQLDGLTGLATAPSLSTVEQALELYPQAKGVLLSSPNYYGMATDLAPIAQAAHRQGLPLIVDEAHGAHFGFHSVLPPSALSAGADAVIQSTHKMLTSMTMSAMLHLSGSGRLRANIVQQRLSMLQSSSPSYPLMASLDLARHKLHTEGHNAFAPSLRLLAQLRSELQRLPVYGTTASAAATGYVSLDPYKLTLWDRSGTLTGPQLQQQLEARGCMVEMSDPQHVLLVFSLASTEPDISRLLGALSDIAEHCRLHVQQPASETAAKPLDGFAAADSGELVSPPLLFSTAVPDAGAAVSVPLRSAAGLKSAEMIMPYPPGIPLLYPGERITERVLAELERAIAAGSKFQGERLEPSWERLLVMAD